MKALFLLLVTFSLFLSCSSLPQVHPGGDSAVFQTRESCGSRFPEGKWQFVHSLESVMPGGKRVFVTGVAVVSSADRSFRCVILTMEGLVIFDAEYDRHLTIHRAVPPFDSQAFAEGLGKDIRLIFFSPPGAPVESGFLKNGASVCRYRNPEGETEDVIFRGGGSWEIRQYAQDFRLLRTVKMSQGENTGSLPTSIPKRIELTANGPRGYKLIMDLVEAVPITE